MRRHYLFAEDEKEKSVGDGKVNMLRLWHNRRCAMLEGDESANGGEANAHVARELTLMWDLAKPMSSSLLSRDGYIAFFARAAKALVQPLSSDAPAIAVAKRDWEYDMEGIICIGEPIKAVPSLDNEMMSPEQFREALMQLAELILPVESSASLFATFFRELRNCVAELVTTTSSNEPEQDNTNIAEPVDRLVLRPLNRIPKVVNEAFLQKLPPSSEALRTIRGLQPPDSREMSLKQLLVSYNPRKFSLTRAFPQKKRLNGSTDPGSSSAEESKTEAIEDNMEVAQRLHMDLLGAIGTGATPIRGRKLHRETTAHWDFEQALTVALTECPALRVAVVGPPGCGKTRLAHVLARRLKLRYLSLSEVVQRAIDRKLRLRRQRATATPAIDGEEVPTDTPPSPAVINEDNKTATDNADEDEEMDRLFQDHDLDAMLSGRVLSRDTALALLRLEAIRSLLAGVGVIVDDVYPCELANPSESDHIAVDYMVALTALPTELEYQLGGSELASTTGRLYSVRELATLKATSPEDLAANGFADFLLPPKKLDTDVEEVQDLANSNDAADPGQDAGEHASETNDQEENEGGEEISSSEETILSSPEPTPAERNEIDPPREPTLLFGSMALKRLSNRYHEYVRRMQCELSTQRVVISTDSYHLVVALATQSLNVIRDHCIQAITGTSLGLSRCSTSREAHPILMPDDLSDASRTEKVKWLLDGDWATLLEAEANSTAESFARLPRRNAKRRLLSKWREFCPVTSTSANGLTLGDPEFAACYSGRIYFLDSREARRAFCVHPLQFLRREVPVSLEYRNYWLITTGAGDILSPSYLETLEAKLRVQTISAAKLLKTSAGISMEMRLMSGQVVSPVEAAAVAAEVLKAQLAKLNSSTGWMLIDLPFTRDVAAVLLEHDCVPDAILLMDSELAAAQEEGEDTASRLSELSALRRQQFQAEKAGVGDVSEALGGTPRVITCPLYREPSDTIAAIERELNPIAPRLDRAEDGTEPQLVDEYDPAVIFAPPVPDKDKESEIKPASSPEDGEGGADAVDPEAIAAAEAARNRALQLQGESGRFCPVAWKTRDVLIPGLPSNVCSYQQKFYAFAGEKEQRMFERNPAAFVPSGPCATANFVPCVLLLGVRGSGRGKIATALAQSLKNEGRPPVEYINVDLASVASDADRRQRLEELKPEEARISPEEVFVSALHAQLKRQHFAPEKAVAQIIAGLGPEASRIPTAVTLEMCFKHDLFPVLVVPLAVSEDDAVTTLLSRWAANLPPPRRKLALTKKKVEDGEIGDEGNAPDEDGGEDEPPFDLEAAREEENTRLREQFAEDQKALDEAIASLRARGIKICSPVNATGAPRQTFKRVRRILDDFMDSRDTLFEYCEVLDMTAGGTMQQLLSSGELLVGKHGLACPVTGCTDSLSAASAVAVVHRDQLYFPRSREARQAFIACPARFLEKASLPPRHQPTCCVTGPSLSGKTRVAQEIASTLGLVYVSPQSAVDWVMQCQGGSMLRNRIIEMTNRLEPPLTDADITHEAICARLRSSECQTRGWVLDGYLLNHRELQRSLGSPKADQTPITTPTSSQSIQPEMLFILESEFACVWQKHQTHADRSELHAAFAQWHQYRLELLDTWTRLYGCFHVRQLDSSNNSLWHVAAQAQTHIKEQQHLTSLHASAQASGRAARSLGVVRTRDELQAHQHRIFQTFCPVELRAGKFYTSRLSSREYCVDFRGSSFWLGSKQNADQFVESPEVFIGCLPGQAATPRRQELWPTQEDAESEAQTLVARAPVNASLLSLLTVADCDFPELKGYCPVTFASGSGANDWASLRHGSVFVRASYRSKTYFFVSEEARRKFCYEPSRYASQSLPVKLPPQVALAKSYPGQLEQQLGAALNEVLLALGSERPKFPQVSTRASACVYLALSLKALQRRYQMNVKLTTGQDRDEDEPDEEQKQRQQHREEQTERDAIARRDAFVRDCRLGEKLKIASTPTNTSCGSGAKVARTMRELEGSDAMPVGEEIEMLRHRFDTIVSGSDDSTLPADVRAARNHARAAFLEYTKTSTSEQLNMTAS